jgi:hypothetical protein
MSLQDRSDKDCIGFVATAAGHADASRQNDMLERLLQGQGRHRNGRRSAYSSERPGLTRVPTLTTPGTLSSDLINQLLFGKKVHTHHQGYHGTPARTSGMGQHRTSDEEDKAEALDSCFRSPQRKCSPTTRVW